MPPDLPSELYSLFVDQVALEQDLELRIETLKACSLAFRAISYHTRQCLFYRIKFPKINATYSIQRFRRLLQGNPRSNFISHLRVLEIELKPNMGATYIFHGLPTVLNILCADERGPLQLHTLKMAMRGAEWAELARDLRDSLYAAVTCRHLTVPTSGLKKLEFLRIMKIPMLFFAQCTQTVKELRFYDCSFVGSLPITPSLSSNAHAACNPRLRLEVYGFLNGLSKGLQVNLDSPAAAILARIKHLALGCCATSRNARAIPSILWMTKDHLETLELRKIYSIPLDILGITNGINLAAHHRLRRFIVKILKPAGDHNFEVFELETNDPTYIEDIEIHIQHTTAYSWEEDLGIVEEGIGPNWTNLDNVLLGPRYPFLRKVDIVVFFDPSSIFQLPVSVQTLVDQEIRALLPKLSMSGRIRLAIVVKRESMPR